MHKDFSLYYFFILLLLIIDWVISFIKVELVMVLGHQILFFIAAKIVVSPIHHSPDSIALLTLQLHLGNSLDHHFTLVKALFDIVALQFQITLLAISEDRLRDEATA